MNHWNAKENIFVFFLLLSALFNIAFGGEGFYNIAHMINTKKAVKWAVDQGANALEVDVEFDREGVPINAYHGNPCDCTCMCHVNSALALLNPVSGISVAANAVKGSLCTLAENSVCPILEETSPLNPCDAKTDIKEMLPLIAKENQVALVLIDSKLSDHGQMDIQTQVRAAGKIVELLEKYLFGNGYKGEVIVGAESFPSIPYIKAVSKSNTRYKDRIHFTIDQEDMADTKECLDRLKNKNIVYNSGISVCSPAPAATEETSRLATSNKVKGIFGMTYTWTVDSWQNLRWYAHYFNGIITNYPGRLAIIIKKEGYKLATSSDRIPTAKSSAIAESTADYESCDCKYKWRWSGGGCHIVKKAPSGMACYCKYVGFWQCGGWVVQCRDVVNRACKQPSKSRASCKEGRGDCSGYF